MGDTREKLIREKVDLINTIDYAMRDFDDYLDECNETCTPPIDKLEDFIADGVISAGYRKREWIPVSEGFPENDGIYLTYNKKKKYEFHFFQIGKRMWPAIWEEDAVTHWMPLPEPPKE